MSKQNLQIQRIREGIRWAYTKEKSAEKKPLRVFYWLAKWFLMLVHEGIKDNLKVRAESLAYLMIFSFVPLLAGTFFVFSFFSQFAFVQESLQGAVDSFLSTFPPEHRAMVIEYGLALRDRYLEQISTGSTKFGIFALGVFLYVGIQTFNNVDRTINHIWGSDSDRPFIEKTRNFLVVAVVAPLVISASLSVPFILRATMGQEIGGVIRLSSLEAFFSWFLPLALTFATFLCVYKFIPVRSVKWRSAFVGAFVGSVGLQLANLTVSIYIKFATHTAYGKAAIFLVMFFWIYAAWLILIVGAQVSYLSEDSRYLLKSKEAPPSMYEGYSLMLVLSSLLKVYKEGGEPIAYSELFEITHLNDSELRRVMSYLENKGWVIRVASSKLLLEGAYVLAKELEPQKVSVVLEDFMQSNIKLLHESSFKEEYVAAYKKWTSSFSL